MRVPAQSLSTPDGRIVVAGFGPGNSWGLARFKPNGKLDRSFGENGTVITPFTDYDEAESIAIDSQGRIVAGGFAKRDLGLARYEPNGNLDPSFGDGGKVRTNFPGLASADSIAIDSQDRIVAAVDSREPGKVRRFTVARYSGGRLAGRFVRQRRRGNHRFRRPQRGAGRRDGRERTDRRRRSRRRVPGTGSSRSRDTCRAGSSTRLSPTTARRSRRSVVARKLRVPTGSRSTERGRIVAAGYARGKFALARYLGR